ncbi:ZIP family metal transporter, partial [Candidatus Bathyarchaeota archaeon]
MDIVTLGLLASLLAGLATGFGALPILITKKVSERLLDVMLGFSAGVMLAATSFSLIIPALEIGGVFVSIFGLTLGALTVH